MHHSLVLNAQNWAVKQIIYANCEEVFAKASFYLKFHCKLWCQTVKTIMTIQREDTAVIPKYYKVNIFTAIFLHASSKLVFVEFKAELCSWHDGGEVWSGSSD